MRILITLYVLTIAIVLYSGFMSLKIAREEAMTERKNTRFSEFVRNASEEEREEVYNRVLEKVCDDQAGVMAQAVMNEPWHVCIRGYSVKSESGESVFGWNLLKPATGDKYKKWLDYAEYICELHNKSLRTKDYMRAATENNELVLRIPADVLKRFIDNPHITKSDVVVTDTKAMLEYFVSFINKPGLGSFGYFVGAVADAAHDNGAAWLEARLEVTHSS